MHLREHMVQICKTVDLDALDSKFEKAKAALAKIPVRLGYLCEFHYHTK